MVTMEGHEQKRSNHGWGFFVFRMEESLQDLRATMMVHALSQYLLMPADSFTPVTMPSLLMQQALASFFHFSAEIGSNSPQVLP
ncbi:hypothetical protein [Methanoregula sp.]|uniref:hypothetical protein n=1 Tax=Methanoregula sp. TaxID=2052170 RepID=UPI003F9E5EE3